MCFPNCAGDYLDTDEILEAELRAAGIPLVTDELPEDKRAWFKKLLRKRSGEVKTAIVGELHGWTFERSWRYWVCSGPGIELAAAEELHASHGQTVRVAGHAGAPTPGEMFNGLAVGCYHVDDAAGLKALADTIKSLVNRYRAIQSFARDEQ